MSQDIIIGAPLSGGRWNISQQQSDWCYMGASKFVITFSQDQPLHYVAAQTITYTGPDTPPTKGQARLLGVNQSGFRRIERLNANTAVIFHFMGANARCQIIHVSGQDITEGPSFDLFTGNQLNYTSLFTYSMEDNRVRLYTRFLVADVLYNPLTETLTRQDVYGFDSRRDVDESTFMERIEGTNLFWEYYASAFEVRTRILNGDGSVYRDVEDEITFPKSELRFYRPITETTGVSVSQMTETQTSLYFYDDFTRPENPIVFDHGVRYQGSEENMIFIPLDDTHFMVISRAFNVMVYRKLSDVVGDISPHTNQQGGVALNLGDRPRVDFNWYTQQFASNGAGYQKIDPTTYIIFFYTNKPEVQEEEPDDWNRQRLAYKVIHQPII